MSNEKNTGGTAFPTPSEFPRNPGMTLRNYFAAKAMQAMHTNPDLLQVVTSRSILDGSVDEKVSKAAFRIADAMLKAREQ